MLIDYLKDDVTELEQNIISLYAVVNNLADHLSILSGRREFFGNQ